MGFYAPTKPAMGRPRTASTESTRCTRRGGRSSTGRRRTFRAMMGAGALMARRRPARGRARGRTRIGLPIFNYGRHEVVNFLLANALFWVRLLSCGRPASGRGGIDALPGTTRKLGEWIDQYGGRENLVGHLVDPPVQPPDAYVVSGGDDHCRRVHGAAGSDVAGGLIWADWVFRSSGTWAGCTRRWATSAANRSS